VIFYGYAVIGLLKFFLACVLTKAVEAQKEKKPSSGEEEPLLSADVADSTVSKRKEKASKTWTAMLPSISPESRIIVFKLCMLFAVDNFASGLAPM